MDKVCDIITLVSVSYTHLVGQDEAGEYVLAVDKSMRLEKRYIKTGRELSEGVEITTGIAEGEYIVRSSEGLKEGDRVKFK